MSSPELLQFHGRVAIVTGAGTGLGRAYALWFAQRGSSVVVNDLGGSVSGDGTSRRPADLVVNEITAKGGKAVADYNSVEQGEKIVQTAIEAFGRVDILVNNAGILRDKSFGNISDDDWDLIQRVHLRGPFTTIRAAWPHFRKQNYGKIILTSSTSGIYGNFGQANYSAAKLALVGLSKTLAREGKKFNIHCNVIAPAAATRLTKGIFPPAQMEMLKPDLIAPIVLWLCHESCQETGSVVESKGGWAAKYRWERSRGINLRQSLEDQVSPEAVRDNWDQISNFEDDPLHPSVIEETTTFLSGLIRELTARHSELQNAHLSPVEQAMLWRPQKITINVSAKDIILYALSIGITTDQRNSLQFLYERDPKFGAMPTFGILLAQKAIVQTGLLTGGLPAWRNLDFSRVLHGEQFIEIHQPIPTRGQLVAALELKDILDKKSGALMIINVVVTDAKKKKILTAQWSVFLVGYGGFGGKSSSEHIIPTVEPPNRKPDVSVQYQTGKDQSAMYRLLGDSNPLHIDPDFAAMGGYDRPILHGLIPYGIACRSVLEEFAANDPALFKAMKARFSSPTKPGHTLRLNMWRQGNRIHLEAENVDTGKKVLSGGYVDLHSVRLSSNL